MKLKVNRTLSIRTARQPEEPCAGEPHAGICEVAGEATTKRRLCSILLFIQNIKDKDMAKFQWRL
ncbi:MAG: hypothetical protein ACI9R3_004790 [Verrucomicrobiales bacterium]|jgi:hypothetical protein